MHIDYNMTGQVAIVTGGAQGIGLACVKRLASSGATVVIWDVDENEIQNALRDCDNEVLADSVDITDAQAVQAAANRVIQDNGKISILVNSAGIAGMNAPVEEYPIDEWVRIMELNLNGTFFTNRAVVANMKHNNYGRIVNVASVAGKEGNPNASAYSASKSGVIGFTKSLGKELAGSNIAVNCITPAAARTRIFDQMSQEHIDYMLSKIPRGRFVETEEIANLVAWLVSEENSFTTGGVFDISGGRATY
ncbi:MAG: SDR family NAD(P)-dependent oxidoreductase [Pseudomonadota bacterium]